MSKTIELNGKERGSLEGIILNEISNLTVDAPDYIVEDLVELYNKVSGLKLTVEHCRKYFIKGNRVINLNNNYWVSREGVIYEFTEMSNTYIINVIELLKREYSPDTLKDTNLFIGLLKEISTRVDLKRLL